MLRHVDRSTVDPAYAAKALKNGLDKLIAAEPEVTKFDTIVGDGDCGIGLKRGAEAILSALQSSAVQKTTDAAIFLDHIISTVETSMDGTSGALYAIYLNALAWGLRAQTPSSQEKVSAKTWAVAADKALESMGKYTPAKPGDRTLVDALAPFVETLLKTGDVTKAAQAADEGSKKTQGMKASLGRTVYVGGEGFQQVPDPGAHGLAVFLTALAEGL